MQTTKQTTNLEYAAAVLRRLTDTYAVDPSPQDMARLSGPMLEIALSVMREGTERGARRSRLQAECIARGLDPLLLAIAEANPSQDLSTLTVSPGVSGWQSFDLVDVMDEDLPAISWLVKPYVHRPSVTAWFGKPKSMKSLLVLDMCLHVAGGLSWLTINPNGDGGLQVSRARIVWIDLENGAATFKRRMRAIASALGLQSERGKVLAYSMPDPWPDLSQSGNVAEMIARMQELGDVGILVIDHLAQALGSVDENSPLIAQVMGNIRQIAETCNLAIVLIHHAKKGQGKDSGAPEDQLRGHGAILANVDAAYLVERDKEDRTNLKITPVAVRGPDAPTLAAKFSFEQDVNLELTQARFWRQAWRKDTDIIREAVLEVLGQGETNKGRLVAAVMEKTKLSNEKVKNAISVLEGVGEIAYTQGPKGAQIYKLNEAGDDESES